MATQPLAFSNLAGEREDFGGRDWSHRVRGCVSKQGLFLLLAKVDMVAGAAAIQAERKPDSRWLRRDLYESDGKTLVISTIPHAAMSEASADS